MDSLWRQEVDMHRFFGPTEEHKLCARRVLGAYFFLLLLGLAVYTGVRLNDLLVDPLSTAGDIAWSALGALLVGFVFALFGAFISAITFLANDALQSHRRSQSEQDSSVGNSEINERRNSQRIHHPAAH